jgi:hypothetical protein
MNKTILKIYLTIALLFFAKSAFAFASLIVLAVSIGTAAAVEGLFLASVYVIAATFATSMVVNRIFAPNSNIDSGATQKDPGVRNQVPPDTTNPIPVGYGSFYCGGKFVDACLTTDGMKMFYVMAISCVSENGQFSFDTTKFYFADRLITFDSSDPTKVISLTDGAGNVDTKISGNLYINLYSSDYSGNVTPINSCPLPWASGTEYSMGDGSGLVYDQQWQSTNRRMNGLAFAVVRLTYSRDAGTTAMSPITFHCNHFLNSTGTAKPGDVWYDYMQNTIYGAAVDNEFLDYDSSVTLNNYSDQLVTFNDYDGNPATQYRYRIDGVIDTNQGILQNVDAIMTACDSWMQYDATAGKWAVVVNKGEAASFNFSDSNIIGAISIGSVDIAQMPNQIEARFPDSTNRDQYNYVNESVPPYLLYPNEPVNKLTVNYDLVNNSVQALYLANRMMEQSREDLLVTINTTYDGIQVNAGDVVTVTNAAFGWNNKLFRATQVKEAISQEGVLGANIQLIEYNGAVYDDKDIDQYAPAANSGLVSSNYFSTLSVPAVVDQLPSAAVPSFSVRVDIPATGRVTSVLLYYTTVTVPSNTDWILLDSQEASDSQPFANGAVLDFIHISLPTDTYYFAYKVGNDVAQSNLSAQSTSFFWLPNPTTSAVAGTFLATFSPAILQIPYGTSPDFTGVIASLYGTAAGGSIDFVASQSDSDALFVNNTWRIGSSSTTGYGDIVTSGITISTPTDGGTFASFPQPTSMSTNPATLTVPVRYKSSTGVVSQGATASLQFTFAYTGATGSAGLKNSVAFLYQWSTAIPLNPNGTSTFTWATNLNSGYTGSNGWTTSIPANPGTPLIQLYTATKGVSAPSADLTTSVNWSTGYSVQSISGNGADGLQTAQPIVYQWAITIPSSPTGTSTYTWSNGLISPIPSGWSDTPGTSGGAGYTLWGATLQLIDNASAVTSTINWTSTSISALGFIGTNGTTGTAGASSRICYSKSTLGSLSSTPSTITTSGSSSFPPNDSWGVGTVWSGTPSVLSAGEYLYQSNGIYNPATGNTVWNVPYLSNLKVGSLSAISVNTGSLTVSGAISSANGNFSVDASGNVLIRNASTGERMTITNTQISVYDSANTLRVLIGYLGP